MLEHGAVKRDGGIGVWREGRWRKEMWMTGLGNVR